MKKELAAAMMVNLGCKDPRVLLDDNEGYIISSTLINVIVSVSIDFIYPNDSIFVIKTKDKIKNYDCNFKIKYEGSHNNSLSNWLVKGIVEAKDMDMKIQLLLFKDKTINSIKNGVYTALK